MPKPKKTKKQEILLRPWDTITLTIDSRNVLTLQHSSGMGKPMLITVDEKGTIIIKDYRLRRKRA